MVRAQLRFVIDAETTGLGHMDSTGPRPDGVISTGIAYRDPTTKEARKFLFLSNPGDEMLADGRASAALRVNKFTASQVHEHPPAADTAGALDGFMRALEEVSGTRLRLEAFNSAFDRGFYDLAPWSLSDRGYEWGECLMVRAVRVLGVKNQNTGRIRLVDALEAAGLKFVGDPHRADDDALNELLLAEKLDEIENTRLRNDVNSGTARTYADVGQAMYDYALANQDGLRLFCPEPAPMDSIMPSMLMTCDLQIWNEWHGGPKRNWEDWSANRGLFGDVIEEMAYRRWVNAGFKVRRQQKLEYKSLSLFGKVDFFIEWPLGSQQWHLVEAKSTAVRLERAKNDPYLPHALQMECYLRSSGYRRGFFQYIGIGYGEHGRWLMHPVEQNDKLWKTVQVAVARIKVLRLPETPRPACTCGKCP